MKYSNPYSTGYLFTNRWWDWGCCFHGINQESETYDHQAIFNRLRLLRFGGRPSKWYTFPQPIFRLNATKNQCCGHICATFQSRLSLGFNDPEMFSPFHLTMHVLLIITEVHFCTVCVLSIHVLGKPHRPAGRVAMLATMGYIVPEYFRFPGAALVEIWKSNLRPWPSTFTPFTQGLGQSAMAEEGVIYSIYLHVKNLYMPLQHQIVNCVWTRGSEYVSVLGWSSASARYLQACLVGCLAGLPLLPQGVEPSSLHLLTWRIIPQCMLK